MKQIIAAIFIFASVAEIDAFPKAPANDDTQVVIDKLKNKELESKYLSRYVALKNDILKALLADYGIQDMKGTALFRKDWINAMKSKIEIRGKHGYFTMEGFLAAITKRVEVLKHFLSYDGNEDGFINEKELRKYIAGIHPKEEDALIYKFNEDRDEQFSFEEFLKAVG